MKFFMSDVSLFMLNAAGDDNDSDGGRNANNDFLIDMI